MSLPRRRAGDEDEIGLAVIAWQRSWCGASSTHTDAQNVPRLADGKPDFSGMTRRRPPSNATGPRGNLIFNADKMVPMRPGAESLLYRPRTDDARIDEPRAMCLPAGFPSGMLYIFRSRSSTPRSTSCRCSMPMLKFAAVLALALIAPADA